MSRAFLEYGVLVSINSCILLACLGSAQGRRAADGGEEDWREFLSPLVRPVLLLETTRTGLCPRLSNGGVVKLGLGQEGNGSYCEPLVLYFGLVPTK